MTISYKKIREIENYCQSPFYICEGNKFRNNFEQITKAFSLRWSKFILAYSYKTNYIPYLCQIIKQKGGWGEVVSRLEYDLALKIGQTANKIVFNGPVKQYEDIELALSNNSIINLDSVYEIEHVLHYARQNPNKTVPIGIRVNISLIDRSGKSHIQNQLPMGRFGFASDNIEQIKQQLENAANIQVVSLHGHTSTADRCLWCYKTIAQTLCQVAEKHFPQTVEYINIGGGIFGEIPESMGFSSTPSFDDYAESVCGMLRQNSWAAEKKPSLVLEPGIAMTANVVSLITRVIGLKTVKNRTLVTVDGSVFHIKPTLHTRNLPWSLISQNNHLDSSALFSVVGSTCMEKDYLLTDVEGPLPKIGDFIQIDQGGAYTVVLSPPFINPAPAIVALEDDTFKVIRNRQTLDDMFKNYVF